MDSSGENMDVDAAMDWFDSMCTQQIQSMRQMKMVQAFMQPDCPQGTSPEIRDQLKQLQAKAVDDYLAAMSDVRGQIDQAKRSGIYNDKVKKEAFCAVIKDLFVTAGEAMQDNATEQKALLGLRATDMKEISQAESEARMQQGQRAMAKAIQQHSSTASGAAQVLQGMELKSDGSTAQMSAGRDSEEAQQAEMTALLIQCQQQLQQMEERGGPKTQKEQQQQARMLQIIAHADTQRQYQHALGLDSADAEGTQQPQLAGLAQGGTQPAQPFAASAAEGAETPTSVSVTGKEFTFEAEKLGFWRQNWKHRYFAISGDDVFYYTDAAAFKSRQLSKGSFRLSPISLFRHVNEPEVFVPQNAGGMLFLMKRSEGKLISLQGKPFTLEVTDVKARTGVSASRTFYMSFSSQEELTRVQAALEDARRVAAQRVGQIQEAKATLVRRMTASGLSDVQISAALPS